MRIPSSAFAVGRYAAVLAVVAGSLFLLNAEKQTGFTVHDKAYYLDPAVVNFVRPGLKITIVSAQIAQDGTISVDYKLADPKDQPLDRSGVQTPGTVSVSFIAAYIPKGQKQFVAYTTRSVTSPITNNTAIQASSDSGGTTKTVAVGEYIYTFKQKALISANAFDGTATHRIGVYGSRNLSEFDLGTYYDDATFDFLPAGGAVASTRDVLRTDSCNKCHDSLAAHGGSRKTVELCDMCHTPQTTDPDTGNTVDMKVMVHKIHMGSSLPSVKAGTPYQIIGYQQSVNDYSSVVMPSDARRCEFCHDPKSGAAQATAWYANPSRAACGSCHDDVNFATGLNHVSLPQVNDNQCTGCHIEKGELEFDASVRGAHTYPQESTANPGLVLKVTNVVNGGAGQKPTVTFSVKDFAGNGVPMSALTGGSNRLALVMAGPTSDYGYTSFGSDVTTPGYVSENPVPSAKCSTDGTCSYTFAHAIPAGAKGSFSIGIEGRRPFTILKGTVIEQTVNYGANNDVYTFSVDGTPVQKRRTVVALSNCNKCHARLSLHGENRNQIEQCAMCHNPSENDSNYRKVAKQADDKNLPAQSVNFALMIHKIHTGEKMASDFNTSYVVVGYGGSHNDFSDVLYPSMTKTGLTGNTAACYMCHTGNSEAVFPIAKNDVKDPQGLLNPAPATTSACTACHQNRSAFAHAVTQTNSTFGESCDTCHAAGATADVIQKHAGK